jgi:hypothetical protein
MREYVQFDHKYSAVTIEVRPTRCCVAGRTHSIRDIIVLNWGLGDFCVTKCSTVDGGLTGKGGFTVSFTLVEWVNSESLDNYMGTFLW